MAVLLLFFAAMAWASVNVQSPALRQLEAVEGETPRGAPEQAAERAGLGFSVQTLRPVGYLDDSGREQPATPAPGAGRSYVFEGRSRIPGVTIYTPKEDPTGAGTTEPAKPASGLGGMLLPGALGAGGLALTLAGGTPWLLLGLLLIAAAAALLFLNRKSA